jgi:hypothetical protein
MHSDRIRQALLDIRDNAVLADGDAAPGGPGVRMRE